MTLENLSRKELAIIRNNYVEIQMAILSRKDPKEFSKLYAFLEQEIPKIKAIINSKIS